MPDLFCFIRDCNGRLFWYSGMYICTECFMEFTDADIWIDSIFGWE